MGRGKSDMGGLGVVECRKGNTDRAQNRAHIEQCELNSTEIKG